MTVKINLIYNGILERKKKQLQVVLTTNPMTDDYHRGIRKLEDIKSPGEAFDGNGEDYVYPDWHKTNANQALLTNQITVYSSYSIRPGVFVSPSKSMAKDYCGNRQPFFKVCSPEEIAWMDADEGIYTGPV